MAPCTLFTWLLLWISPIRKRSFSNVLLKEREEYYKNGVSLRYSWPILTCLITATIMFFTSATAHLMHQKSHYCHMTCFLCDFGGISFNGYGAAFMQTYMCSPIWYYGLVEPYLVPLIGFMSMLCCIFNSLAQTLYSRPYPPMKRYYIALFLSLSLSFHILFHLISDFLGVFETLFQCFLLYFIDL